MVKPEWGMKRYCQKCHTKYYDMQKDPITCPSCGTAYQPEFLRSRDELRSSASKADIELDTDVNLDEDNFDGDDSDDDDEVVVEADISKDDDGED